MGKKRLDFIKYVVSFISKKTALLIFLLWGYVALSLVFDFYIKPLKSQVKILLQVTVLFFILKEFGLYFKHYKRNLKITFSVWSRFSWSMFFQSVLVAAGTLLISLFLMQIPFFSKGWTNLFFEKSGSILTSFIQLETISFSYIFIALVILTLFIFIIPHFALLEELVFRKGRNTISKRMFSSISFGLVHMIMGIPLGASIALMFTGYFYSTVYSYSYSRNLILAKSELKNVSLDLINSRAELNAMRESSVYHSLVNTILFGTIILLFIPLLFF